MNSKQEIKALQEQVTTLENSLLDAAASMRALREKHEKMAEKHLELVPLSLSLMIERDALKKEVDALNSMIEHYKDCITKQLDKIRLLEDTIYQLCTMKP